MATSTRAACALLLSLSLGACTRSAAAPAPARSEPPAQVLPSGNLRLHPDAERRLDILAHLRPLESRLRAARHELRGIVELPPGSRAQLSSPLAGILVSGPARGDLHEAPTRPGERVAAGQILAWVQPWLDPAQRLLLATARAEAEGSLARARGEAEGAHAAWERARELLAKRAVPERVLDEARVRFTTADADLSVALARVAAVSSAARAQEDPLPLRAPIEGVLSVVLAVPGEFVSQGAPLAVVARQSPLWVRVAVSLEDQAELQPCVEAGVVSLGDRSTPGTPRLRAARVLAPPPTATRETVDLYFEVRDAASLTPGQAVSVELRLSEVREWVIPARGVLLGPDGEATVFVALGAGEYARRAVRVLRVSGDLAVLAPPALPLGTQVVTAGASELLGVSQGQR